MEGRFVTWVRLQLTENPSEREVQYSNLPYHEEKDLALWWNEEKGPSER